VDVIAAQTADHRSAAAEHPARGALFAFAAFVISIYASAPQLIPPLAAINPGKTLIALAFAALLWSAVLCGRRLRLGTGAGGGALYLFFLLVLASPIWSLWPRLSLSAAGESLKYAAGFFVAVNVLDSPARIRRGAVLLALASLIPAVGAIHSSLTGAHIVEETRAAWIGVFSNPNFLAYHLVVAVPLALALRELERRQVVKLLWLGAVAVLATAILLTESRGGSLGLGGVLLLWLVRGLARGRMAVGAAVAVAIALLMAPGGPWNRAETRATLAGQVDASAQGRIDAWRTAQRIVAARPLDGVGIGAFVVGYDRYAPGDAGPARTAHNSFLMIAAEVGLPALVLFALALTLAFLALGRAARAAPAQAPLIRAVQTSLFGFVVCSLTGGYTFTWPLYFLLGMAAAIHLVHDAG
jgi:putative inorganic carbon (hco3(-)) transporter